MRYLFTPQLFNQIATFFWDKRWRLLQTSLLCFVLFFLLENQINLLTPNLLVWFALFILFCGLQMLVVASFIFFFKNLPSTIATSKKWLVFYSIIEWCEAIIFTLLLPFPIIIFMYMIFQ